MTGAEHAGHNAEMELRTLRGENADLRAELAETERRCAWFQFQLAEWLPGLERQEPHPRWQPGDDAPPWGEE